jgi:hypothetical protein
VKESSVTVLIEIPELTELAFFDEHETEGDLVDGFFLDKGHSALLANPSHENSLLGNSTRLSIGIMDRLGLMSRL